MVKNKEIIDFTIGSDTELILVNAQTGKLVKAGDYLNANSRLGVDANGRTAEIRSKPSKCPLEVVESVKAYMQEAVNDLPQLFSWKWLSGSFVKGYPIGNHTHFKIKYDKKYLPYLDNYIGAISLLLEPKNEGIQRRKYDKSPGNNAVSYGKMSDIREKNYGGFEYRVSSSCISSPYTFSAMLCLAKAIMYEALNNPSFKPLEFIEPDDFITVNQNKIRRFFPQLWKDITKLTLYPKYKKHIDIIKYLVVNNKTWQQGKGEIKRNWGIKDFSKFIKPKIKEFAPPIEFKAVFQQEPAAPPANNLFDFDIIWNFEKAIKNNELGED
jgi:hypothetical protein